MRITLRRLRWPLAGILCLALGVLAAAGAGSALGASPGYDISGSWNCCGAGGASAQTFNLIEDDASGALSGSASDEGGIFASISGSVSGDSVTIVTTYNGEGYVATFIGTITDSTDMSGSWSSNANQSGTWSASLNGGMATTLTSSTTASATTATTMTTTTTIAKYPTGTEVSCYDEMPGAAGDYDQCTATVGGTDAANPAIVPGGKVTFSINSGGSGAFPNGSTCTLQPSQDGGNTAFCAVDYSPAAPAGTEPPITATYGGDATFSPSSGSPSLEGAPDDTTTDTTPTDTTAQTDTATTATTTTTDCPGAAGAASADLRRAAGAACSAVTQKAAALLAQIQALDAHIASVTAQLATVDPDPDKVGAMGFGLGLVAATIQEGAGKVLNGVTAVTGLATSVSPAGLQADLQSSMRQRAALQAQLNALIGTTSSGQRRALAPPTAGVIATPVPIRLALPAGLGKASAVFGADAAVVEYQKVMATTLARATEAAADSLRPDAAKQWTALAGYDTAEARALKRLSRAESALRVVGESALTHHRFTAAEVRATRAAIEHPSTQLVTDARLLGVSAVLSTLKKQAKVLSASQLAPAAISAALLRTQAGEQSATIKLVGLLNALARQETELAALDA